MDPLVEADKAAGHRDSPLSPANVDRVFEDCMRGVEVNADGTLPDTAVSVQGVVHTAVLSWAKLTEHADDVGAMLDQLPDPFRAVDKGGGGGGSFLDACMDRDGNQWTGVHLTMEKLLILGIATGQAEWCAPRDMWDILPGGMPYVMIDPQPMNKEASDAST